VKTRHADQRPSRGKAQQLELRIGADHAEVNGRYRECWRTASPLEPNTWMNVSGRAEHMR
jgi:hypothetical protein